MSFFKPRVNFPLDFASPFSVMTQFLWNFLAETKRTHQSTVFQTFQCSNESSPNSSRYFWNHKVMVYSNFASVFSVMRDNSVFLLLKPCIVWAKRAHWKEIFSLLSSWVKIHQIPHVRFETTSQFFFKLYITLQCYER